MVLLVFPSTIGPEKHLIANPAINSSVSVAKWFSGSLNTTKDPHILKNRDIYKMILVIMVSNGCDKQTFIGYLMFMVIKDEQAFYKKNRNSCWGIKGKTVN